MADEKIPAATAYYEPTVQNATGGQYAQQQQQPVPVGAVAVPGVLRGDVGWYDRFPRRIVCQFCGYEVITGVDQTVGLGTHVIALGLCFVGCWPCCLIPYCVDDCKDVKG